MAADPIKLQAQLHKLQAQFDEASKEKDQLAKGMMETAASDA
jgi:hypothetical protein